MYKFVDNYSKEK